METGPWCPAMSGAARGSAQSAPEGHVNRDIASDIASAAMASPGVLPVRRGADSMSLPRYASRGAARFLLHYVARRGVSHSIVLASVLAAVGCAVGSQYAVKLLVDTLGMGKPTDFQLWSAVGLLLGLVAGDNLLWRLAGWVSTYAFVVVGGDIRLELFNHLSGHGTRYFTDRFPGALASRITTAANTAWTIENSATWNTIPPGLAVLSAIALLAVVDWQMTAVLLFIVLVLAC